MAYQFIVNQTPGNGAAALVVLKDLLKTAGWTLKRASDGTTMSAVDPSPDPVNAAYLANNNAWFVVRQPTGGTGAHAGTREVAFQRGTANTSWRMVYSYSGGFSAGGDVTHIGTAADENNVFGGGTNAAPTFSTLFDADGTYRFNTGAENAGPFQWYAVCFPTGAPVDGTAVSTTLFFDGMKSGTFPNVATAEDVDPFMLYADYISAGGSLGFGRIGSSSLGPQGWLKKAAAGEGWVRITGCYLNASGDGAIYNNANVNPHNEKDDLFDLVYVRRGNLAAPNGYKGVSSLLQYRSTGRNLGDLVSSGGNNYINFDDLVLPWPAATTLTI